MATLGTADIISSAFSNNEEDIYNRFQVRFDWDYLTDKFRGLTDAKTSSWSYRNDKLKTIEAKWISNENEAIVLAQRLAIRYEHTVPRISFTTNLNKIGLDIGTLLSFSDANSGMSNKIVQVIGVDKDWESRSIEFQAFDGEALWQRRGFAYWMGGTSFGTGGLVSGTSTSGWGTSGTQANINSAIYGSCFTWF